MTLTGICLFGICKFKTKDNEKSHKKLLIAAIIVFCTGIFLTAFTFFSEAAELVITAAKALATAPGK